MTATAVKSSLIMPQKPADAFLDAIKSKVTDLDNIEIFPTQVLVAHFIRDKWGSILSVEQSKREDRYQGKVGLVLKLGGAAFVDDAVTAFKGFKPKVGDFVIYRNTDGWDFDYCPPGTHDKVPFRLLLDGEIKGVISRPDLVY